MKLYAIQFAFKILIDNRGNSIHDITVQLLCLHSIRLTYLSTYQVSEPLNYDDENKGVRLA